MASSHSDGSQTATLDTEHTLATITTPGIYQLQVDLNNMVLGDVLIVRSKLKVRSTGTTRLLTTSRYAHVPSELVAVTIPVVATNEVVFTIEQTDGTGRAYPWEVVQLDG